MSLERDVVTVKNMIALSRRGFKGKSKKSGNIRSKMLKMIMPHLSRETGERLAKAIENSNPGEFSSVWDKIKQEIRQKLEKKHHTSNSSSESSSQIPLALAKDHQFLAEMHDLVVEEMQYSSFSYNFHNYSNVLAGKGDIVDKTREFIANGACLLNRGGKEYILSTKDVKVLSKHTNKLQNVDMEIVASLSSSEGQIKEFKERGPLAVAATEILFKAGAFINS